MQPKKQRISPGLVRDAILNALAGTSHPLSVSEIHRKVNDIIGNVAESSVKSYLLLNTPEKFIRVGRGLYELNMAFFSDANGLLHAREDDSPWDGGAAKKLQPEPQSFRIGRSELFLQDCFEWISSRDDCSVHAIVTDPPYGVKEYSPEEIEKLRIGRGGVWRIPPSFDGNKRSPLPRFTVLNRSALLDVKQFFLKWGRAVFPKLVPGANIVMASNPLLASIVSEALSEAGLERRGELVRLTMTMRGGDRPKNAELEFNDVSVMPRSMWEPWLLFRKPVEGRIQDNLRKWGTGGFRRIGPDRPFGDVVKSSPTNRRERALANHPSLKPQSFLRQIVRAVLPLGKGVVADTFAGSGSTLAAAEAVGYESVGVERDEKYWQLARVAIPKLRDLVVQSAEEPAVRPQAAEAGCYRKTTRPGFSGRACDTASLPLVF